MQRSPQQRAAMSIPDAIAQQLFKTAADESFTAITVTEAAGADQPGEIVYVNDAFTEMTGYEPSDVLGQTPGMLQGPKTEQGVIDRLDRKIQNGEPFHGETVNYRKDGSEFIIEWKVLPITHEGETTHHLAVQRDVTDRRE
jgi:PAS domain S-box-containing protein